MVAAGRGVTALPRWLAESYAQSLPLALLRLGKQGIQKHIHLGIRESDRGIDYLAAFCDLAKR